MKKKAIIILGLGFGDEGKGLATDYFCLHSINPIVIRFNGGQQAGHTVVTQNGEHHIFSNFGSGTLRGIPTYWSKYCTFSPAFFLEELQTLKKPPKIFLDYLCPVTTHYDVLYNRAIELTRGKSKYGSCGLGFGATIERNNLFENNLCVKDLLHPSVYQKKLQKIKAYYRDKIENETPFNFNKFDHETEDRQFDEYADTILNLASQGVVKFVTESSIFSSTNNWKTYIFEGAQGILLDINCGHQPYVTKSHTTSKNALKILDRNFKKNNIETEIFYITRIYQTRHGAGPFKQCKIPLKLKNIEGETNKNNEFQGVFRRSHLNVDLLNYALNCDSQFSDKIKKNLFVTCIDQVVGETISIYKGNLKKTILYLQLPEFLDCNFKSVKFSFSNCAENLGVYS